MTVTREELESIKVGQSFHFSDTPDLVFTRNGDDSHIPKTVSDMSRGLDHLIFAHTDGGIFGPAGYTLIIHEDEKED
jgi:hypothetical protein